MCQGNGGQNPYGQQPYQSGPSFQPWKPNHPTGGPHPLALNPVRPQAPTSPMTGGGDALALPQTRPMAAPQGRYTDPMQTQRMRGVTGGFDPMVQDGPSFTPWTPNPNQPPPPTTPPVVPPGGFVKPPKPTGPMQAGQQAWSYRPDIIDGGFGAPKSWQPILGNGQQAYLTHMMHSYMKPDQWASIDRNDILGSVGKLTGIPYNPATFG